MVEQPESAAELTATPASSTTSVEVRELTKRFGDRIAYEQVSLRVERGEVFGLLGPNGAGKTTLVRTLSTLIRPTSGSARICGLPLEPRFARSIRDRVAMMPESAGLYGALSVEDNIRLFARLRSVRDVEGEVARVLQAVGLERRRRDRARDLSKGLRQRVAIARVLVGDPEVIFLDEPTSGLDPVATRELRELVRALRAEGRTILITTHQLDEAERLCDRVAILQQRLRALGTPEELRAQRHGGTLVVRVLGDPHACIRELEDLIAPGSVTIREDASIAIHCADPDELAPSVAARLVGRGIGLRELRAEQPRLEDVYLELLPTDEEAS